MKFRHGPYMAEEGNDDSSGGAVVVDTPPPDGAAAANADVDPPADSGADDAAGFWPSDWRQKWAGADEKRLARLGRFASPEAAFDALESAMNRIRAGETGTPFPKDGTAEQVAEWRKGHGIPDAPDAYDIGDLPEGVPEDGVKGFLKYAHEANYTPDQVKQGLKWYAESQARLAEDRVNKDATDRMSTEDALRQEWGNEYRDNLSRLKGTLSVFPKDVQALLTNARLADGTAMFNNADIVRGFMSIAHELDPAGTIVPGGGGDPGQGLEDEIGQIEKFMRENRAAYNKDDAKQSRLRELYDAREKVRERSKR